MFKKFQDILKALPENQEGSQFKRSPAPRKTQGYSSSKADNHGMDFVQLVQTWPKIVGPLLSKHTYPLKIQAGTLIVISRHSGFAQELHAHSESIREQIFQLYPGYRKVIQRIQFRNSNNNYSPQAPSKVDTAAPVEKPVVRQALNYHPEYRALKSKCSEQFKDIENGELKNMLIDLCVQKHLLSQK